MTMILDGTLGITATGSLTGLTTPITAAQGGTGAATLTANNVLLGNGTSAVTFVAPSTSGNLLTSNGTTWASTAPAAAGGMTLLGTVAATSGNSVSLGSLVLTSYTELHIAMKNMTTSISGWNFVTGDNAQNNAYATFYGVGGSAWSGIFIFNLVTGSFMGNSGQDTNSSSSGSSGGWGNITTASTTLYFRLASTNTYSGSGSFTVYGVK